MFYKTFRGFKIFEYEINGRREHIFGRSEKDMKNYLKRYNLPDSEVKEISVSAIGVFGISKKATDSIKFSQDISKIFE